MSTTRILSIVICIKAEAIVENFDDVYVIYKSTATVRISTKTKSKGWKQNRKKLKKNYIPSPYDYCIDPSNISFEREY